jgi:hypothetical protein
MSPDEIRLFLHREYPCLVAEPRTNPDGWSFFMRPARRGANSNRILRAVRTNPQGVTQLKLAVSSRQSGGEKEFPFAGSEAQLREFVETELRLFHGLR